MVRKFKSDNLPFRLLEEQITLFYCNSLQQSRKYKAMIYMPILSQPFNPIGLTKGKPNQFPLRQFVSIRLQVKLSHVEK